MTISCPVCQAGAGEDAAFHIPDGRTQELSEQFEGRAVPAARKIGKMEIHKENGGKDEDSPYNRRGRYRRC